MTKGDNEIIPGAVHRSLGIYLIADETPRKPQLGDRLMKGLCASNGVPFLQMRSVGSHSTSGREKEGIKERTGWQGSKSYRVKVFSSSFHH